MTISLEQGQQELDRLHANIHFIAERVPVAEKALQQALTAKEPGCALFGAENPGGPAVLGAIAILSEAVALIAARLDGIPAPDPWKDA